MLGLLAEVATPEHPMPAGVSIRMITRDWAALDGPNWSIEPTETNWRFIPEEPYCPEECETFAEAYKCAVEFARETA